MALAVVATEAIYSVYQFFAQAARRKVQCTEIFVPPLSVEIV